jgi:hypothetical protein
VDPFHDVFNLVDPEKHGHRRIKVGQFDELVCRQRFSRRPGDDERLARELFAKSRG